MEKRPVLLLAYLFLTGILMREQNGSIVLLLAVIPVGIVLIRDGQHAEYLLLLLVPLAVMAGYLRMGQALTFRSGYLSEMEDGAKIRLVGEITRIEPKTQSVYYYLTDCSCSLSEKSIPVNDVLVYLTADEYIPGQQILVSGTIELFDHARNEGNFDAEMYYQSQKIDFAVRADSVRMIGDAAYVQRWLHGWSVRLRESITACGGRDGILLAMLLADRQEMESEIHKLYVDTGISHILAISGLHVSLLGIGLYRLLRKFLKLSYYSSCPIVAAVMIAYGYMVGAGVSTRRAIGMLLVYLLADVLGCSYDMLSGLGLMVMLLLWENPFLIHYSGFVFSVVAVLGVGVTAAVLIHWYEVAKEESERGPYDQPGQVGGRQWMRARACIWKRSVIKSVWFAFAIQITTLPLVAYYYYEIPTYAVVVNVIVLALAKYLLISGALAAVVGCVYVPVGRLLMVPANLILQLYEGICRSVQTLPGAHIITGRPTNVRIVLYYGILLLLLLIIQRRTNEIWLQREKGDKRKRRNPVGAMALLVLLLVPAASSRQFEINILDVGQGDAAFIQTEEAKLFIDGGSSDVSGVGTYRILPFLKYRGVRQIDYWFVSHTDDDHVNGLCEVIESGYPIQTLVMARKLRGEVGTKALAQLAESHGIIVLYMTKGDALQWQETRMECLFPEGRDAWMGQKCPDVNDECLVLQLSNKEFTGLFTGDISKLVEEQMLEAGKDHRVTYLKVAHHGSKYSSDASYLQKLSPKLATISCARRNRYGHPGAETIANIEGTGARIFYTMKGGRIRIWVDRKGLVCVDEFVKEESNIETK